jgi:hypothetical protein
VCRRGGEVKGERGVLKMPMLQAERFVDEKLKMRKTGKRL